MSYSQKPDNINISDDVLRATDVLTQRGPVKQVVGEEDLIRWVRSQAYRDLIAYINNTSLALRGHRLTGQFHVSEQMQRLCGMFDILERTMADHAPKTADASGAATPNKRSPYRMWLRHMFQIVLTQLARGIRADKCQHIHELGEYLRRSFGNATSLEFGPGNELMFLFFLCGLFRSGILVANDTVAAALMLFSRYIHLVRRLVTTYSIPMATNPRCCIEDYFVVPYLWGAAQLCQNEPFTPMQSERPEVRENYRQDYMMLNLIENLPAKAAPLSNNAFQLWCLLSVPTWPDVYRALERCYVNHVLASFHTVENAIFWELMTFDAASAVEQLHRPSLSQRYVIRPDQEEWTSENQKVVSFAPVRSYVSLDLFSGFQDAPKQSEEESDGGEDADRLAMLHPTNEDEGVSAHLIRDSNSSLSAETKFFLGKYE